MKVSWGAFRSSPQNSNSKGLGPLPDIEDIPLRENLPNGMSEEEYTAKVIAWEFHFILISLLFFIILFFNWKYPKNPIPKIYKTPEILMLK